MASVRRVASIYARGNRLWGRVKDERDKWLSVSTPYNVGQEQLAERYIAAAQKAMNARARPDPNGPPTVAVYAARWLAERKERDNASHADDVGRINNHVLPKIGKLLMQDVTKKDIREMVRALRKTDLAPRTVRHVFGVTHSMFRDASVDDVVEANPCVLKHGELPGKIDKDSEWREAATYTVEEVVTLTSSEIVPHERRVQYALKALAGLRHGEVAGLRWRHYDTTAKPLGRLVIATSYDKGRTKTDVTRKVPVHAELAARLAVWRKSWTEHYGRAPKPDDLVVPTRNLTMVDVADAGHAMHADLEKLGLRVMAGETRKRGGHDLRSWFIGACQEAGAHREILRLVTHTPKSDVMDGYSRISWASRCAEVSKLSLVTSRELS